MSVSAPEKGLRLREFPLTAASFIFGPEWISNSQYYRSYENSA